MVRYFNKLVPIPGRRELLHTMYQHHMMKSRPRDDFRIIILFVRGQPPNNEELWRFLQIVEVSVVWSAITVLWRHWNVVRHPYMPRYCLRTHMAGIVDWMRVYAPDEASFMTVEPVPDAILNKIDIQTVSSWIIFAEFRWLTLFKIRLFRSSIPGISRPACISMINFHYALHSMFLLL